ncbi:flavodoxin family protein [Fusobacterium sp. MFO224]|uniref:flavodoxin family protein n=1 Tax=Fusobacterium sp. MFO224 TaxID=3378070 RepID=UPI003854EB92
MKTLIAYSTKTGNTKKVAEAINEVIDNSEIKNIDDVDNLDYDLVIVGAWIDKGTANKEAVELITKLKNKMVAFFFTLGAYPHSAHAKDCIKRIENLFIKNNNEVIGYYLCQGAVNPKLIEFMKKQFPVDHPHGPNPERIKRWTDASSHPNLEDLENAKLKFKSILEGING